MTVRRRDDGIPTDVMRISAVIKFARRCCAPTRGNRMRTRTVSHTVFASGIEKNRVPLPRGKARSLENACVLRRIEAATRPRFLLPPLPSLPLVGGYTIAQFNRRANPHPRVHANDRKSELRGRSGARAEYAMRH